MVSDDVPLDDWRAVGGVCFVDRGVVTPCLGVCVGFDGGIECLKEFHGRSIVWEFLAAGVGDTVDTSADIVPGGEEDAYGGPASLAVDNGIVPPLGVPYFVGLG